MVATALQQELVRKMARIYAGLYMKTAKEAITKAELEKIAYGWNTIIAPELPETGTIRTFYFINEGNPKKDNKYSVYVWVQVESDNNRFNFEKLGQVSYDMSNHETTVEFNKELEAYRDVADKVPVEASKYTEDRNFVKLEYSDNAVSNNHTLAVFKGAEYSLYSPETISQTELEEYYHPKTTMLSAPELDSYLEATRSLLDESMANFEL